MFNNRQITSLESVDLNLFSEQNLKIMTEGQATLILRKSVPVQLHRNCHLSLSE